MDGLVIRRATTNDISRIIELYEELAITASDMEVDRDLQIEDYQVVFVEIQSTSGYDLLVADYRGEVVGTVVLLIVPNLSHKASPWAMAENLIIDRRFRRQGIGRILMEYLIKIARDSGCYRIILNSDKRRTEAHHFYRALGFEASAEGFRLYF